VSKLNWDRESRRDKVRERGGDPIDLPREHSSTNRCRHDWSGYFRAALLDPRWQRRCTKCGYFSAPRTDLPAGAEVTDSQKRPAKKTTGATSTKAQPQATPTARTPAPKPASSGLKKAPLDLSARWKDAKGQPSEIPGPKRKRSESTR